MGTVVHEQRRRRVVDHRGIGGSPVVGHIASPYWQTATAVAAGADMAIVYWLIDSGGPGRLGPIAIAVAWIPATAAIVVGAAAAWAARGLIAAHAHQPN